MTPPSNCPYTELTAKPCWNCSQYMPDIDQCRLNPFTASQASNGYVAFLRLLALAGGDYYALCNPFWHRHHRQEPSDYQ